jgi:hypothetical protein
MKLKLDFHLAKRLRLRVALKLGLDEGAAFDVRMRVGDGDPLRWKAALAPGRGKPARELPATPKPAVAAAPPAPFGLPRNDDD